MVDQLGGNGTQWLVSRHESLIEFAQRLPRLHEGLGQFAIAIGCKGNRFLVNLSSFSGA